MNLDESGPIAVQSDGTAAIQIPQESRGGRLYATTYVIAPANPTLQAISTDCVSAYGVKLVSDRVAQAVCGKGVVTTDLSGGDPETVLALGAVPVEAFDYNGVASAAVRPACDGEDEVEPAGADPMRPRRRTATRASPARARGSCEEPFASPSAAARAVQGDWRSVAGRRIRFQ
jgi:hypothetical protein